MSALAVEAEGLVKTFGSTRTRRHRPADSPGHRLRPAGPQRRGGAKSLIEALRRLDLLSIPVQDVGLHRPPWTTCS
jgi:hypothetical protein